MPALFYFVIFAVVSGLTAYIIIALRGGVMKKSRKRVKAGITAPASATPPKPKLDWKALAENRWKDGWIMFAIVFLVLHFAAMRYFPTVYHYLFTGVAVVWLLQLAILLQRLFKEYFATHKGLAGATTALVVVLACATLSVYFEKWRESDCTVKGEKCWEREATAKAVAARVKRDSIASTSIAALDSAIFVPPIDRTCSQKENPLDTVFVVPVDPSHWSGSIIVPEQCKLETAKTDSARLVYLLESKVHLTDPIGQVDTIIPGQFVRIPDTRARRLRGYRTPGVIQVHIFPIKP